jgi:hypothetical protein
LKTLIIAAGLVAAASLAACTRADPDPAAARQPAEPPGPPPAPETTTQGGPVDEPVTCSSLAHCNRHDDRQVRVIGIYRKFELGAGKGAAWHGHVQIDLGGGGPVLGRYWHDESKRDAAEVAHFEGARVAVVGRYRSETPPNPDDPPHAARLSVPVLLDIERIERAGDDEGGAAGGEGDGDDRLDPSDLPPL